MHSLRWGDPCIEHLLEFQLILIIGFQCHLENLLPHEHADLLLVLVVRDPYTHCALEDQVELIAQATYKHD